MSVLCKCGCGELAPIASKTCSRRGWVKGQPLQFVRGHNGRTTAIDPFTRYVVEPVTGCWNWDGALTTNGYGSFGRRLDGVSITQYAHRAFYEKHVGPIPVGLVIDHLCNNKPCVNPEHLEAVTQGENVRRGTERRAA